MVLAKIILNWANLMPKQGVLFCRDEHIKQLCCIILLMLTVYLLTLKKKKKLEFMIFCGPYFIVKNNSDVVLFIDNPVATCRIRYVA